MAVKVWEEIEVIYCDHLGCKVALEAQAIYPAEHLPDQPARVIAHRCSKAADCIMMDKASCVWTGANPLYDPFQK